MSHTRTPLHPAALASVPYGVVLVRVRVRRQRERTRTRTINIEALCAAPPEALPHSPSQMPLSCPVAPDRPELIELQATKPSPTPTRAEEDIATTPGCGPAVDSGHRAFAHAVTHRGKHRHDAGLWICRAPRLRPRRHAEAADLAPPTPSCSRRRARRNISP